MASCQLTFSAVVFNWLANLLHWILVNEYGVVNVIHCLKILDVFVIAAPSVKECGKLLQTVCEVIEANRVTLAPEKVIGQASIMMFLTIKLDVPW